jgi:hypothetical protein
MPCEFTLGHDEQLENFKFNSEPEVLCRSVTFLNPIDPNDDVEVGTKREVWWLDRLLFVETYPEVLVFTIPRSSQYDLGKPLVERFGVAVMEWLGLKGQSYLDYFMNGQTLDMLINSDRESYLNYYSPEEFESYV